MDLRVQQTGSLEVSNFKIDFIQTEVTSQQLKSFVFHRLFAAQFSLSFKCGSFSLKVFTSWNNLVKEQNAFLLLWWISAADRNLHSLKNQNIHRW